MGKEQDHRRGARRGAALLGALALSAACENPPVDATNFPPQGALEGTVVYSGPPPCVQRGHVLGAAQLLVFSEDLLPPPQGLGTTAAQFGVVSGDVLFASVVGQLPASAEDSDEVVCPPADAPPVTVSTRWSVGPLPTGRYQVRGFYDRDGDFSPIMKLHQLPTAGDVGGGAIANLDEALAGKPVRYQTLEVGRAGADGRLTMPDTGAQVRGIVVTLGQVLPFSRPIFHMAGVKDERPTSIKDNKGEEVNGPPLVPNTDPNQVVLAQDERFLVAPTNYASQATKMFLRVVLGAGLPEEERALGSNRPYSLQTQPPHDYFWLYAGVEDDGSIKTIPETPIEAPGSLKIANLFPQAIFAKIDDADPLKQAAQAKPAVILQGLVLNQNLLSTTVNGFRDPATGRAKPPRPVQELEIGLRPSVICVPEPQDVSAPVYVVTPQFKAINDEPILDPESIAEAVRKQLGNRPNVQVIEGCLPKGSYQINLVYDTGQAWTTPNEAGRCQLPNEEAQGERTCALGQFRRDTLPSQTITVAVGDEREAGFCASTFAGAEYENGVPRVCLRGQR